MPPQTTYAVREDAGTGPSPAIPISSELSVLVPTRNEAGNIEELLRRVSAAVTGISTDIVFIDDSDDTTPAIVRAVVRRGGGGACQVMLIHRQGAQRTGGLGGAVVDGLRATRSPWACVLDADLQHPPEVIPMLLARAERAGADLVVASRHCDQGRSDGLGPLRALVSTASASVAKTLFPRRLRGVTDPMSGFFLVRRDAVDVHALRPRGFKILLELLVRCPSLRSAEVGFTFAVRHAGESKGSLREGLRYVRTLCELRFGPEPRPFRPLAATPACELLVPPTPKAGTA
jgi:dolichol-phosphate mannosyltransferase